MDTERRERVAFQFIHPHDVQDQTEELIRWLGQHEKQVQVPPCEMNADKETGASYPARCWGHYNFVRINPFPFGNGRVGRLFMNLIFLRNNFNPAVIEPSERQHCMSYLHQADKGIYFQLLNSLVPLL